MILLRLLLVRNRRDLLVRTKGGDLRETLAVWRVELSEAVGIIVAASPTPRMHIEGDADRRAWPFGEANSSTRARAETVDGQTRPATVDKYKAPTRAMRVPGHRS